MHENSDVALFSGDKARPALSPQIKKTSKMDFLSKAKSSNIRDFLAANNTVVLKFSTAVLHFSTTNSSRSKFSYRGLSILSDTLIK